MRRAIRETFRPRPFPSVESFVGNITSTTPSGFIEIDEDIPLHLQWTNRNSKLTFVIFSAAITRRRATEVPIFSGSGVTKHLPVNILKISDPSLIISDQLNLGWYLGSEFQPTLVDKIHEILSTFAQFSNLVMFGASGGGFASLNFAAKIPNSTAIVSNPQTDITRFSYFPTYCRLAWPNTDRIPIPTEIISSYSTKRNCQVFYIQNAEDYDHVNNHLNPFQDSVHIENKVLILTPKLTPGHIGPAPDSFKEIFTALCENKTFEQRSTALKELEIYSTKMQPKNPSDKQNSQPAQKEDIRTLRISFRTFKSQAQKKLLTLKRKLGW